MKLRLTLFALLVTLFAYGQSPAKSTLKQLTDGEKLDLRNIQVRFLSAQMNKTNADAEFDRVSKELQDGVARAYVKTGNDRAKADITNDLEFVPKTGAEIAAEQPKPAAPKTEEKK